MVFGLVVFVADRLSDCRYLSRCCSPLDSQRVRCREGLAMKSFSDRPFRVNAIPRHRGCVLVHRSLRRVPRRGRPRGRSPACRDDGHPRLRRHVALTPRAGEDERRIVPLLDALDRDDARRFLSCQRSPTPPFLIQAARVNRLLIGLAKPREQAEKDQ